MTAELGMRPLAILTDEASGNLPRGVDALLASIEGRDNAAEIKALLASAYVLCGLRYERDTIKNAFGRLNMLLEESTTYQGILEEGRSRGLSQGLSQGVKAVLLRMGSRKFGRPATPVAEELQRIHDTARLEALAERILDAGSWEELLASD